VAVPDIRERWRTSLIEATTYDWAVEHEHVAGVLGRLIWGTDTSAFYRDIARLAELPSGTSVLDIPCGGGPGEGEHVSQWSTRLLLRTPKRAKPTTQRQHSRISKRDPARLTRSRVSRNSAPSNGGWWRRPR
jgi:hypothetical protein